MVNTKRKSPRQPVAKTRQSTRRKDVASDITALASESSKPTKSAAAKHSAKDKTAKSTKSQHRPRALRVGDKVPLASLEIKVLQDDGTSTSLGEQLEKSHAGGVLVFVYSKMDDDTSDFVREFEELDYDYQPVDVSPIGLSPESVAANATWKEATQLSNPLLSDPRSSLLKALNFNISKGSKNVGFVHIDKERNVLAHKSGGQDAVLLHLDSAISAFMQGKAGEDEDDLS